MPSIDRIDSIFDIPNLTAEQKAVEALVLKSIEQIKQAREQSIDFNINTKSFDDYNKKIRELEKTITDLSKKSNDAAKASVNLTKTKEQAAKASERERKEQEKATAAITKAANAATVAARPYKQLALQFKIAAERAQDLAAKYGTMDKRAQAAAREANNLNNKLKEIDKSIGNNQRNVGNYSSALDGVGGKLKGLATNFLGLIGIVGAGSLFQSSIDEFIEMDKNVRLLQNTLRNIGVPEAFDRISASADKLAKQFTYLDNDDVLKVFNQLIVYGKLTEDQMNELLPVIVDFAAATGQDLPSATSVIIKALEGNGKALKEYGINIKDAKNTSEAFGIIMTELAPKVSGVGKAFGESSAGGLASAQQRFKDLKEEIGAGLLPILNSVLSVLLDIGKGAVGAGKALTDAFSGQQSFVASILGSSDNEDIAFEADQVFKTAISGLKDFQKILKQQQAEGRNLNRTENDLNTEYISGLQKRLDARQKEFDQIKKGSNREAIMSAIADIRGLQRAIQELNKDSSAIKPTGDPNKGFGEKAAAKVKQDTSAFDILKANIELDKEFDLNRLNNDKLSYQERLQALIDYGNDSARLIQEQAKNDLNNAELTKEQRLKIENDKNNALIRLSQELTDKLTTITAKSFETNTKDLGAAVTGMTDSVAKSIKKAQDEFAKLQEDAKKKAEELKKALTGAFTTLATEVEGLFFDIFTNAIERQKNAVQDQIDLLEQQKQKDIEVANQTIANAQLRADTIAVIEARAAAKRQQLELKQRQLDQQKARFEKARAVTDIIQSTSIAVVNALGSKPFTPANIALAAVVGAIGAVQIARVLAQPIPRYAEGTDHHKGGLAVVGDGGKSEAVVMPDGSIYKTPATDTLVNLPKGAKVIPDYSDIKKPSVVVNVPDTSADMQKGFTQVVNAIKKIPQPIIRAERAWTQAHRTGSSFRNYINRSI